MTRDIDALVAETLADRPLPASYTDLDDSTRRAVEKEAKRARLTPEALWTLSRQRSTMTHDERYRERVKDGVAERNHHAKLAEEADTLLKAEPSAKVYSSRHVNPSDTPLSRATGDI